VNWDVLPENRVYKKRNSSTTYLFGPKYVLLKENVSYYHSLTKNISNKVKKILIAIGGTDVRNLTPRIIDALKEFNELELNVVIGGAYKNREEILKSLKRNKLSYNLLENQNDLSKYIYEMDLAISAGGLSAFQLVAIGTPFLGIGAAIWETKRLRKMQELGICKFIGDFKNFKKEDLHESFRYLFNNKKEREKMSLNGKKLVDGKGIERVSKIVREVVKNGNLTN